MKRFVIILVLALVLTFALAVIGASGPFVLLWALLTGWIPYAARVLPEVRVGVPGVVTGALCLAAVMVIGHLTARWLWSEVRKAGEVTRWRVRWTLAGVMLVLLMFVCGIAATGVVHQAGWLMRSEQSMFTRLRPAHQIHCLSNMRQLGQLMQEHADKNGGALPDALEQLQDDGYLDDLLVCPAPDGGSYVYHGRGLRLPLDAGFVLVTEPPFYHQHRSMGMLMGDLSTRSAEPREAAKVMARQP